MPTVSTHSSWPWYQISNSWGYFTLSLMRWYVGASGVSVAGRTPTGMPASGWQRSNSDGSDRKRGLEVKLCRGGGHEVAH